MEGATVIYVATDGDLAGLIGYLGSVKQPRRMRLKLASGGIRIVMLTGITSLLLKQSRTG
ncbi:Silver exporting P-type ATPase [Escherichia coli]|nr:Silver exporting P-type ATPase [Escherichia coli]